jgi:hypothetical protein
MPTLKYRRHRGDMIEMFKNMSGNYDKEVTDGMLELDENTRTRGHEKKCHIKLSCKYCSISKVAFNLFFKLVVWLVWETS